MIPIGRQSNQSITESTITKSLLNPKASADRYITFSFSYGCWRKLVLNAGQCQDHAQNYIRPQFHPVSERARTSHQTSNQSPFTMPKYKSSLPLFIVTPLTIPYSSVGSPSIAAPQYHNTYHTVTLHPPSSHEQCGQILSCRELT